jgi:PAS domain S-box-containing protein
VTLWRPVLAWGVPSFDAGVDPLLSPHVPDLRGFGGLASVIEDAAAAIILFDDTGSIRLANAMAGRMFGYDRADLLDEQVEVLFSRSSQDILLEGRAAFPEDREPPAIDAGRHLFAVRRDGSAFPAEVGFSSVQTPNGPFVKAIVTDLSELVALSKDLERSERRLRRVIETAPGGIVVVDADGVVTLVNRAAELMFGYGRDELVGSPIEELLSGVVGDADPREAWELLARPDDIPGGRDREVVATRKDGGRFTVEVALSAVESDDGPLLTAILTDITERKRAEVELRESVETLRRSESKRRILVGQLVRATEDERSRLAGEVHDGSVQAMTAVGMRLATLKRRSGAEGASELEEIQSAVSVAVASLRHLMFDLRPPALDESGVGAALEEALDRLEVRTSFEAAGFEEPPSELRTILFRIGQEALANLRKHAEAGEVEVRLSSDASGWRMAIVDDGRGFDPSMVTEDPMHMGLASMRERAEMGGGTLRIVSAPGEGTTIDVSLPRAIA